MRTITKIYNWEALIQLAVQDMLNKHGAPPANEGINFIGGFDCAEQPFVRIDLTPLDNSVTFES